jgi:O-antigen ligase/tetratricopeptide (TPR) repeat protein
MRKTLSIHFISALAILIAISSPWFDLSVSNHSFVKTYIAGIGVGILALTILWMKNYEKNTIFNLSWIKLSLLVLFILGTLSVFWSNNVDFTITKWLIWFTILCSFFVGYNTNLEEKDLLKLCWGLLISIFLIAIIGILQYLFDFSIFGLTQAVKPSSTFGNRNMSTQPIVLIAPLVLFLLFSSKTTNIQAWILSISTALIFAFIFYTKTRSSWVSLIAEVVVIAGFLLLKYKNLGELISWNKHKTFASITGLLLLLLMLNLTSGGFQFTIDEQVASTVKGAGTSASGRFNIWSVAIEMIKESPIFGTGLGTWFHNEVQGGFGSVKVSGFQRVHNDFLELGVELGIVGMLIFLVSTVSLVVACIKIINLDKKTYSLFYFFIFVALTGSFVQMQFSFPYQLAMPAFLFGLYAGFITKRSELFIKPLKVISFKATKAYKASLKGVLLVTLIVTSMLYIEWIQMYGKLNQINKSRQFGLISKAVDTSVYHLEVQNILGFMSQAYLQIGDFDSAIKIEENILRYWPNGFISLGNYAYSLLNRNRYGEALDVVDHLKKVSPEGFNTSNLIELKIYRTTNQTDEYVKAFNEFLAKDSLSKKDFRTLSRFAVSSVASAKYTPTLYKKYIKKYPAMDCEIESSLGFYYLRFEPNLDKIKAHLNKTKEVPGCLDNAVLQKYNEILASNK